MCFAGGGLFVAWFALWSGFLSAGGFGCALVVWVCVLLVSRFWFSFASMSWCCCLLFVGFVSLTVGCCGFGGVVCVSGVGCFVDVLVNSVVTIYVFFVCCFAWLCLIAGGCLLYGCGLMF